MYEYSNKRPSYGLKFETCLFLLDLFSFDNRQRRGTVLLMFNLKRSFCFYDHVAFSFTASLGSLSNNHDDGSINITEK